MTQPKMFYFGPWDGPGHYLVNESGHSVRDKDRGTFPWNEWGEGGKPTIDGRLQPREPKLYSYDKGAELPQGIAALHHLDGWTALCFWDRSVDTRGACNSNYFAEGIFTFEEMVEIAKTRFVYRWNKMNFEVRLVAAK
jgi:hypothetical protein